MRTRVKSDIDVSKIESIPMHIYYCWHFRNIIASSFSQLAQLIYVYNPELCENGTQSIDLILFIFII